MKTVSVFKSVLNLIIFCFLMIGVRSSANAQITSLYYYDDIDSLGMGCYNTPITGGIYWYGGTGYTTGDNLAVNINWGDGNVDSYPINLITASAFFASIVTIPTSHTYTSPGNYHVTINAIDNYTNTFNLSDSILVVANCGFVSGTVEFDDGDAVYDWGDIAASGVPMILTTSINNYGGLTDSYGSYGITNIDHTATTYHLEIDPAWLASTGFSVIDPVGGSYNFTTPPITYTNYPFLLNCGAAYNDASVSGYGWGFRAGLSDGYIDIWMNTFSCSGTPADIDLSVTFDPMLTVYSTTLPSYNVIGNTITSSIPNVSSWTYYRIYFTVPAGTPALTPLVFNTNINVTNYTDNNATNNAFTINSEVRNSWDPNDKSTNVGPSIDANATEEINYTVRFQNLGNADAINVVVTDTIDAQFDLSSFGLVALSHAGSYSIDPNTRVVTFTFPNIMLPAQMFDDAGSQGFVRYKITENPGLAIGSELNNTAYIYFDGNAAVITNTTANVNTSLGIGNEDNKVSLSIYPQPTSEIFYIAGINTEDILNITILDGNGRAVLKTNDAKITDGIYIGNLAAGMYFVSIETAESSFTEKLCVQH